jgi:hypothetical protein
MRRIGLAVVFALSLTLAPLTVEGQPAAKVWRIGVLVAANPRLYDGFIDELRGLGYIDGQNVVLEFRNAEGKSSGIRLSRLSWSVPEWTSSSPVAAKGHSGQSGRPRRRSPLSSSPRTTTRWP